MKVALIFDFDGTLAADTTHGFLEKQGVDCEQFWQEVGERQANGFCRALAYLGRLIQISKEATLTQDAMKAWGEEAPLYQGVEDLIPRLKEKLDPSIELHSFCISTGILSILEYTRLASYFDKIWASEFEYDADGFPIEVKRTVNFTEKTRYLFNISKGIFDDDYLERVNERQEVYEIPLENMIMVGDGFSDIPVFSLLKQKGGYRVGVRNDNNESLLKDSRVDHMVEPDFSQDSEAEQILLDLIATLARRKKSLEFG